MGWTKHRAEVAALSRSRSADDPDLINARRNMRAELLADHVAKVVAQAPPLSAAQRDRISVLLRGGAI